MGPNEPAPRRRGAALGALLAFLATPLLLILLVASAVSGFLGDIVNAVRIALMVVLRVLLNCLQAYRSQRAAERLRDAVWGEIARHDLVPGDVLRPTAGDQVPADAYLLETRDLHLQQAALTGESMPVEKDASALTTVPQQRADARNMVVLGTSVVSGTVLALVVATGPATAFGDSAARRATRPPETEFERGIRHLALVILQTVLCLVLFVLVVNVALHRSAFASLLCAVGLDPGIPLHDHDRHADTGRRADGVPQGPHQTPRGSRRLGEYGCAVQQQNRYADHRRHGPRPVYCGSPTAGGARRAERTGWQCNTGNAA
jgi:P-type Mg2+ transporter